MVIHVQYVVNSRADMCVCVVEEACVSRAWWTAIAQKETRIMVRFRPIALHAASCCCHLLYYYMLTFLLLTAQRNVKHFD